MSFRSARMAAGVFVPLALLWAAGCAPGDESPAGDAGSGEAAEGPGAYAAEPFPSPAGPGSGEPYLSSADGGVWMSWIEPASSGSGHRVATAFFDGSAGEWSPASTVAEGDDFFVNWADFPSVQPLGGRLVAHWLQRGGQGTYDYGVRVAWSGDQGATWSEPWTPHGDDTPTEHGFVSFFDLSAAGVWAVWLDGRAMVDEGGAMAIRGRRLPLGGQAGPETVLDAMTCECCQTDAVVADGVPVVAFRDRREDDVRNIHVTRLLASGWTESEAVHDDGWVIGGCPVNGPALAARGAEVAVAWFTAPAEAAQVNVAFSDDSGASFGAPRRVDQGGALGRVDVIMLDDGTALATWLAAGAGGGAVLSRRVAPDGKAGAVLPLAEAARARASGFPRMARLGGDRIMLAWTSTEGQQQVRVAVLPLGAWDPPS